MLFPTLYQYEWEGQLLKLMKVRLLVTTEVIEKKFWEMLVSQGDYREVFLENHYEMRQIPWVSFFFLITVSSTGLENHKDFTFHRLRLYNKTGQHSKVNHKCSFCHSQLL